MPDDGTLRIGRCATMTCRTAGYCDKTEGLWCPQLTKAFRQVREPFLDVIAEKTTHSTVRMP